MRSALILRLLLIAVLAIFSGPRPSLAAVTDGVVICGADGVKRAVLFDFETGAPATPDKVFEHCPHCLVIGPAEPVARIASPKRARLAARPAPAETSVEAAAAAPTPPARAPPA